MYIEITVDLTNYDGDAFDLRLSDYHTIKKMIDIARQAQSITEKQREGHWIRVVNKDKLFPGDLTLAHCGITTGDRLEII
ncbi:EsaB/YukD family protein [Sporosarcina sp. HYO08]|uniref:EsaB/YukD family protein n=1 Tax=Sporosarcina sp. HYO08 TaxID=1759557 RepID=UPI00079BACB3|nr:EsaB/YukD family protein [Sporosarcina sp. HYO08]KXH78551.1 ubiquitin [Sporosarcina sp. HYO08]